MQIAITDIMAQNKESVPGRSRSHSPVHNVDGPGEAELEAGVDRDLIEFIRRNIKVFDRHMHMTCTSTELLCHIAWVVNYNVCMPIQCIVVITYKIL